MLLFFFLKHKKWKKKLYVPHCIYTCVFFECKKTEYNAQIQQPVGIFEICFGCVCVLYIFVSIMCQKNIVLGEGKASEKENTKKYYT